MPGVRPHPINDTPIQFEFASQERCHIAEDRSCRAVRFGLVVAAEVGTCRTVKQVLRSRVDSEHRVGLVAGDEPPWPSSFEMDHDDGTADVGVASVSVVDGHGADLV